MDMARALHLFDEFSELDAKRCAEGLSRLREDDPGTAALLARMLEAAARGSTRLDAGLDLGLLGALIDARDVPPAETGQAGLRIGPFRLVSLLGRGGMGEVWLAERDDADFEQRVAVKLLHHGLERADAARRFAQERRILAGLAHPDIARLIDGGVSAEGQSWYAMEYVEGRSILEHAEAQGLDARGRVELVLRAASAVAAAQAQDIVHRDLKPSNILVDATGRPRLLDFGIAKWLSSTDGGEETATGLRALSPSYAAPEQVLGEPISRATDVYALGVVLHELLVGERPNLRTHHSLERMAEEVRAERPLAPGEHARRLGSTAAHGIDAALDDIVLTCLQRDPSRRYADAAALAADLRRWLEGERVTVRGTARRLRWAQWSGRGRRWAVPASLAAVLVAAVLAWPSLRSDVAPTAPPPTAAQTAADLAAATERYRAARAKMAAGDLASLTAAEQELEALTLDHPDFMPAYALAANVLSELGWQRALERGEALRRLRSLSGRALVRNPSSLEARILAAHVRFAESQINPSHPRYLAALREHEMLLQESPDDRGLLVSVANLNGILGRLEEVLRHARRANEIDASDDQAFVLETRALVGLARWDEAMVAQREALARSPRRGETFDYVAEGRAASGQFAEAFAAIEVCRRAGADRCDSLYGRTLRMLRADPPRAPLDPGAAPDFMDVLRTGGSAAGAAWIEAEETRGRKVYSIHAYSLLGVVLAEKKYDDALAIIARRSPGLLDGDPALPHETDWLLAAGVAYRGKGDEARAIDAFTRTLEAVDVLAEPTRAQLAQLPDVVALAWLGRDREAMARMERYVAAGWSHERAMTENTLGDADPVIAVLSESEAFRRQIAMVRERNARVRDALLPK